MYEYRFLHKYFHPVWCIYVLLIRLFSFKNPFREISAYLKGRKTQRSQYLQSPLLYPAYENFQSSLIESKPFISIIIPTLNRYTYLKDVLKDLEEQDYSHFEVIVVEQAWPRASQERPRASQEPLRSAQERAKSAPIAVWASLSGC